MNIEIIPPVLFAQDLFAFSQGFNPGLSPGQASC